MLILSLKLPPESNTKASDFTSLRMVLPKIAKWRRISVRAREVGFVAFQKLQNGDVSQFELGKLAL